MFILPLAHVKKAIKKPSVIQNLSSSVRTLGMVRITGLEPAWVAPHEPESCAYANSATTAGAFLNAKSILP